MSVYKITSFNITSPALPACVPTAGRQGWDINAPKFQQGIHALIIWNIIQLKRRERRILVISIPNPRSAGWRNGATEKKPRHYRQTLISDE